MKLHRKITYTIISVFSLCILWGCFFQLEQFTINVHATERLTTNLDINQANFPDTEFRRYLKENFANGNDFLTPTEVENITTMIIDKQYDVQSIIGVSHFVNLEELDCTGKNISDIDVRNNVNLKKLSCGYTSKLKSLQVNDNIEILLSPVASLTELDVSHCPNLTILFIDHNQLKTLDVSQNTALEKLSCGTQPLESLDISKNKFLQDLSIDSTNISTLDLTNNPKIINLSFSATKISEINIDHLANLASLLCDNSDLTNLRLLNNESLETLNCNSTFISSLSFPEQNQIEYMSISDTPIETLDTTNLTMLKIFNSTNTQIKSLDFRNSPLLEELYCHDSPLTSLDISENFNLKSLYCQNTNIAKLDIHNNTELALIDFHNCKLMSLDIRNNINLEGFNGEGQHPETILLHGKNSVDLKDLDAQIDVSKLQDLQGAELEGTILKNITLGTDVTYTYDVGEEMDSALDVTLHFYGENTWITPLTIANWTYKENGQQPNASAAWGNVQFLYSNKIDGEYTNVLPTSANAWYVKAYIEESEEYKGLESDPVAFQIAPRNALSEDIVVTDIKKQEDIATFLVKDKEEVLERGVDFDVTSTTKDNTTTVNITFKGNYTGVITKTFHNQTVVTGINSNRLLWTNVLLLSGITLYVSIKKKKKA